MSKLKFRSQFSAFSHRINWYPGHMHKGQRKMQEQARKVQLFLQVKDARIPLTSNNPMLSELLPPQVKIIQLYNKIDLAQQHKISALVKQLNAQGQTAIALTAKGGTNVKRVYDLVQQQAPPKFRTVGSWIMIGGMPNVGKSSLINALRQRSELTKRHVVRTAPVPCVTRGLSGFKMSEDPLIYVIDTPGIAYRRFESNEDGFKLAACGLIRDGIISSEIIFDYALYSLNRTGVLAYVHRYGLTGPTDDFKHLEAHLKDKYKCQEASVVHDKFLHDFRTGKLGKILLDDL